MVGRRIAVLLTVVLLTGTAGVASAIGRGPRVAAHPIGLAFSNGRLLVADSALGAVVAIANDGKQSVLFRSSPYVLTAIAAAPDGSVVVATKTTGNKGATWLSLSGVSFKSKFLTPQPITTLAWAGKEGVAKLGSGKTRIFDHFTLTGTPQTVHVVQVIGNVFVSRLNAAWVSSISKDGTDAHFDFAIKNGSVTSLFDWSFIKQQQLVKFPGQPTAEVAAGVVTVNGTTVVTEPALGDVVEFASSGEVKAVIHFTHSTCLTTDPAGNLFVCNGSHVIKVKVDGATSIAY